MTIRSSARPPTGHPQAVCVPPTQGQRESRDRPQPSESSSPFARHSLIHQGASAVLDPNVVFLSPSNEEAPTVLSREGNVTGAEPGPLSAVVGGTVKAALGANVTLHCPVRGEWGRFRRGDTRPAARRRRDLGVAVLTLRFTREVNDSGTLRGELTPAHKTSVQNEFVLLILGGEGRRGKEGEK